MAPEPAFKPAVRFTCGECGRSMLQLCGPEPRPTLCGVCRMMPGWLDVPAVRALVDPHGHANPPDLSAVPSWPGAPA